MWIEAYNCGITCEIQLVLGGGGEIVSFFVVLNFSQDWRELAKAIGLGKYIHLLENRAPNSTRLLLLKWAEKPRWTVNSLLYALKQIGRHDVCSCVESKF